MRTALVGKPTVRFDAHGLVGPAPTLGRVVERVESHGRHLEIVWDDGLVLHTGLRLAGTWHLYREGERWRRSVADKCVEVGNRSWVAVCFAAPIVETYRQLDRSRHPGLGTLGPDLSRPDADVDESINRLYHHRHQSAPVAEVLLDDHVATGVGNVYRCESLWAAGIHPFAPVSSLDADDCARVIENVVRLARANLRQPTRVPTPFVELGLAVYGRNGQNCARCGDTVTVCRSGEHERLLYWCAGCQTHRSPIVDTMDHQDDTREMDPHPAAMKFLHSLPWRRSDLAG